MNALTPDPLPADDSSSVPATIEQTPQTADSTQFGLPESEEFYAGLEAAPQNPPQDSLPQTKAPTPADHGAPRQSPLPEMLPSTLSASLLGESDPPSEDGAQSLPKPTRTDASPSASEQGAVNAMPESGLGGGSVSPPAQDESEQSTDEGGPVKEPSWFDQVSGPVTIKYDFRDQNGHANEITDAQKTTAVAALNAWSTATGGKINFVQDTTAASTDIVNIGTGDLAAYDFRSQSGGMLAVAGSAFNISSAERPVTGVIWADHTENWDTVYGNGSPAGTVDYFTVVAHEAGHVLGFEDTLNMPTLDMMSEIYLGERGTETIEFTVRQATARLPEKAAQSGTIDIDVHSISANFPDLDQSEVQQMLQRAAAASASQDAIIAIVDRNGNLLGVRAEADVLASLDEATLVFAIDGAVAKARTAAFFSNGDPTNVDAYNPNGTVGPITSRTVRFISQSTVTQREVESNPNIPDLDSTVRGPGFVAPIGLGGHFPPEVRNTPPVDLFGIEHTNRDSIIHPGDDGIRGTADDFLLRYRFNIDPAFVPAGQEITPPESYGLISGRLPSAQSRGIATLPGGVPLYRDTNGDGIGDTLIGGIGVFFPGPDGYATHEQGFIPGIGQTETQRTNAPRVLEAEYIALVAAGGSTLAVRDGAEGAKPGAIGGIAPVEGVDLPFGRIDLVGIQLQIVGPTAGIEGVKQLIQFASANLTTGDPNSGADQVLQGGMLYNDGTPVPEGFLVTPHASTVDNLSAADVENIINAGIAAATHTRAAIRLDAVSRDPGARTRMVFAVTDSTGEVLGLYRMKDATVFSIDVAVAKARNVSYYADPAALQPVDQVPGIPPGVAFTNRTFRFLSEPRFPSGVDNSQPPVFSILNDPGINPATAENLGAPAPASAFQTVLGYDAFNPMTNFRDPGDATVVAAGGVLQPRANQNGIVFFPGSTPLYQGGSMLVGGLGVSGDGVDQDDVVTFLAAQGYLPNGTTVLRADQTFVNNVRLPYIKFLRNPFG